MTPPKRMVMPTRFERGCVALRSAPLARRSAAGWQRGAEEDGPEEVVAARRARPSGPVKRTWPRSMNTARSAMVVATFTDCSTTIMVVPSRGELADDLDEVGDDGGGEAEGELVDDEQPRAAEHGLGDGEHLLLAAGQRRGLLVEEPLEVREQLEDLGAGCGRGSRGRGTGSTRRPGGCRRRSATRRCLARRGR